ncbi:MAG TPA: TIGR00266 family protein [Thermoplasmatales archaeon]|nr:TIGR00266 family protein [Thermoplasmatales archaeon]
MKYRIVGNNLQMVIIDMEKGERVYAEAGSMVYMSPNMKMEAKARGGLLKGIGRKLAGETFFLTEFTPENGNGYVSFAGNAPGTIIPIEIESGREFIVQKDAFLCAEDGVELSITFQKRLGSMFFGGEGFILEKLSGKGMAFIHACGDMVEIDLKEGESVRVDTGSVVGWDAGVDYTIQMVKGIKTIFFGGEGLFLTTLKGPEKVILQSMTLHNLAMALQPYLPNQGQTSGRSGVLGTFLDETLGR